MDIPEQYKNKNIYLKAKKMADDRYKRHSAYKSMYLTKTYEELGGKYKQGMKPKKLNNWREEKWVKVYDYLENKKLVCGSGHSPHACRPSVKLNKDTPITIQEVIAKHGRSKIRELALHKRNNPKSRINWEKGEVY